MNFLIQPKKYISLMKDEGSRIIMEKTIDFFVATSSVDHIDRVVLAGGSAQILNLDEVLRERFQVAVEVMNPFRNIRYSETDFDPEWINQHAPAMAVAVGLAVRRVGE